MMSRTRSTLVGVTTLLILVGTIGKLLVECRYYGNEDPNDVVPIQDSDNFVDPADLPLSAGDSLEVNPSNGKPFYVSNHAVEDQLWSRNAAKLHSGTAVQLGDIGGLEASKDFLYVFHRANRTWTDNSFNDETNIFTDQTNPIDSDTVLALDLVTGEVMFSWGKDSFHLPHGISVDSQENVWLTDVALHQVFRYRKNNFVQPDLVLGERFVPGNDQHHFCKPTDVAIVSSGFVYIADGYCNSRVMIFSPDGHFVGQFADNDNIKIPHSLALLEVEDLLCVADRENGRILCYSAGLDPDRTAGQLLFNVQHSEFHKVYAIAHIGDIIFALNGGPENSVGYSVDLATENIVDVWSPANGSFYNAHDITIGNDGQSFFVGQLAKGPQGTQVLVNGQQETIVTTTPTTNQTLKIFKFNLIESQFD